MFQPPPYRSLLGRYLLFAGALAVAGGFIWLVVQDGPTQGRRGAHQHSNTEAGPVPEGMPSRSASLRNDERADGQPNAATSSSSPAASATPSPNAAGQPDGTGTAPGSATRQMPSLATRFGVGQDAPAGEMVPPGNAPGGDPAGNGASAAEFAGDSGPALEAVRLMLRDYRSLAGENPVGTNSEIMTAMMGGNKKGAQLGPPEGQKLNGNGELLDPWGTPFFFHQLSRMEMEIRSAGPDKQMWTGDDLLTK